MVSTLQAKSGVRGKDTTHVPTGQVPFSIRKTMAFLEAPLRKLLLTPLARPALWTFQHYGNEGQYMSLMGTLLHKHN